MAERTMDPFPKALADLMTQGSLEQLELAVLSDVSQSSISLLLRGQRAPRPSTIQKLAAALGVEPEYFLEYRQWKAEKLVREAMQHGLIELEDIKSILSGKDYRGKARPTRD